MIHGIRRIAVWCFGIISSICLMAEAQPSFTNEVTGNDMRFVAGKGKALSMLSFNGFNYGFNYTDDVRKDTIDWKGFHGVDAQHYIFGPPLVMGEGCALVCLKPDDDHTNSLFIYTFPNAYKKVPLAYNPEPFEKIVTNDTIFFAFFGHTGVWFGNAFWVACYDGGLVKVDVPGMNCSIFRPGKNKKSYSFSSYVPDPDTAKHFPDSSVRTIALTADDRSLWVACEKVLWRFDPQDTVWTTVNNPSFPVTEYLGWKAKVKDTNTTLFTMVISQSNSAIDTGFYAYAVTEKRWKRFITRDLIPVSFAVGARDYIYVLANKNTGGNKSEKKELLYKDSLSPQDTAQNVAYAKEDKNFNFDVRMSEATEKYGTDRSFTVSDFSYAISSQDTFLYATTNIGLFYSLSEHSDEVNKRAFKYAGRYPPVSAGLKRTYAKPGIINTYYPKTEFVYNLAQDDDVTIDIFDFNMDHVVRIINDARRKAGIHVATGRSTVPAEDTWDGTINNKGGRMVAPGVYYYKISTKKGTRAFGKIIVASSPAISAE